MRGIFCSQAYVVRTFTGAWIETSFSTAIRSFWLVRTFTGAWIETLSVSAEHACQLFAPSRVRGLKHDALVSIAKFALVRTFTGAWIETGVISVM